MIGTDRNIPGMPQTAPQKASEMMMPNEDSRSARPISIGSITLPGSYSVQTSLIVASVVLLSPSCTWATRATSPVATIEPTLGM